ncbi:exosortase F system-associated membrane protein [Lacinutrix salivirga]
MTKYLKYLWIFLLFLALVAIRFFENELFYDPYLLFFKNDYLYIDSPRREVLKLVSYTSLRYVLNSLLSIAILYAFFKDKSIVKFSALVYVLAFVILIALYLYFVLNPQQEHYYIFFNIRRFLIQPLLLILLLPAFYYQRLKS